MQTFISELRSERECLTRKPGNERRIAEIDRHLNADENLAKALESLASTRQALDNARVSRTKMNDAVSSINSEIEAIQAMLSKVLDDTGVERLTSRLAGRKVGTHDTGLIALQAKGAELSAELAAAQAALKAADQAVKAAEAQHDSKSDHWKFARYYTAAVANFEALKAFTCVSAAFMAARRLADRGGYQEETVRASPAEIRDAQCALMAEIGVVIPSAEDLDISRSWNRR